MRIIPRLLGFLIGTVLLVHAASATGNGVKSHEPGSGVVSGAGLEPFFASYQDVAVVNGEERRGRTRQSSLQKVMYPGGAGLRFNIAMIGQEATVYDELHLLRDTLSPVMRTVSALTILHKIEVFDGSSMKGFTISKDGATAQPIEVRPQGRRFAGGCLSLILAGLPLKDGYRATFPIFSTDMGPDMANLAVHVEVVGRERIEAAGRTYDTWVVEVTNLDSRGEPLKRPDGQPMAKAKKWLSHEAPYEIRSQWGPSHRVELVEVR